MNEISTPPRIAHSVAPPALPARPRPSRVAPTASTTAPDTVTRVNGRSVVAASRIAATGGTREALTAGIAAASMVIRMPTANAPTMAAAGTPMPARCAPMPTLANTNASSAPTPMPAPRPMMDAITPITAASVSTELMTCRRLAPIARIRASSRVRWATMIEKVLRIRNTPTNSATPAKPSRM